MATALSRSPLYVRGGRLHAFEKLFALTLYIDRKIWPERCSLAQRSGGLRGRAFVVRELPRRQGWLWGWAAQGRKGLTGQGWVGEGSCLELLRWYKVSWGWATKKGAAKVRCVASSTCDVIEQCTFVRVPLGG